MVLYYTKNEGGEMVNSYQLSAFSGQLFIRHSSLFPKFNFGTGKNAAARFNVGLHRLESLCYLVNEAHAHPPANKKKQAKACACHSIKS